MRTEGRKIRTKIRTPRLKIPTRQTLTIMRQTQNRSLIQSEVQRGRGQNDKRGSLACRRGRTERRKRRREWSQGSREQRGRGGETEGGRGGKPGGGGRKRSRSREKGARGERREEQKEKEKRE